MILRINKTTKYTIISNHAADDKNLSLKAKGLIYYLLTKPDKWQITNSGIASQLKEGKDAIASALNELEENGYLKRETSRSVDGKFKYDATLSENPQYAKHTVADNPTRVNPPQVNTDKVNTKNDTNVSLSNDPLLDNSLSPKSKVNPDVESLIDNFEIAFGLKLKRMTAQRRAAFNLVRRYGLERAKQGVLAAAAVRAQEYAPQIINLEDLWDKWDKLALFYEKKNQKQSQRVVVIPKD